MRIDAHQHFWSYDPVTYDWIGPGMEVLARDFLPEHLLPELESQAMDGAICVQARHDEDETRWLLELAGATPQLLGGGGVDRPLRGEHRPALEPVDAKPAAAWAAPCSAR